METKLNHKVTIYIPSTIDGNKPARREQRKQTKKAMREFSAMFGGATKTAAVGAWISETKGLITERQNLVYSYTDCDTLKSNVDKVKALAERLRQEMKQECVSLEIDNELQFI